MPLAAIHARASPEQGNVAMTGIIACRPDGPA